MGLSAKPIHFVVVAALVAACGSTSGRSSDAAADGGIDGQPSVCTNDECGPVPQFARTLQCADGTTAGPICSRYPSGKCAWSLTACPNAISCTGLDPCGPAPPGGFCAGLGNSGVCVTDGTNGCTWRVTCSDLPR
ncbi:MAG TPA: hypothetical protein VN903_17520 [Polyangia bacterium]|nr:hypothetical protein [Polyangia bacterium]